MNHPLQTTQEWVDKQKRRKANFVSFNEALFGKNILAYIIFRLRYYSINVIFTMAVHVLEFYFLTLIFTSTHLENLILFRAAIFVINAGWWGMLEVMRSRIRHLRGSQQNNLLARELGNWQFLAILLLISCFITSLVFGILALTEIGSQHVLANCYIAAVIFQLGLHIFVEVRRSGIYAKFRVFRPLFSILLLPLASMVFLMFFWWLTGGYTLVLNTFCSAILGSALSLYYIKNSYTMHQWPEPIWPKFKEFRHFIPQIFIPEFFWAGLASIFISLEGMLIWIMYYYSLNHAPYNDYYKLFYFIAPLLNASSIWGRLFYFDIKKCSISSLNRFIKSFNIRILYITPLIGFFFWLITALFYVGYFQENAFSFSLLLLVFFILRSSMAYLQINAFSNRYYVDVVFSGLITLTSVFAFISIESLYLHVFILFVVLFLGNIYIYKPHFLPLKNSIKTSQSFSYGDWLNALIHHQKPTTIISFKIDAEIQLKNKIQLQKILSNAFKSPHILWIDNHNLLLFFASNELHLKDTLSLISIETAGIIENYRLCSDAVNGLEALQNALKENRLLPFEKIKALDENHLVLPKEHQAIFTEFVHHFPFGICYEFKGKKLVIHNVEKIPENSDYFRILVQLVKKSLASPLEKNEGMNFSVSVYCDVTNNTLIFIIPISYENYKVVNDWNLAVFQAAAEQFSSQR
ncbi:hypothetical protein Lgra_1333 [Legionella gratiana]|uniref:Uncharacterized protein n=1 Tax=Legionella gratiana TaxID=45066 RepID=A0A378JFB1_9GAMM|nr:hypothetical protein [Legionella gratiana]KTD11875.1 hypothetical protein Lgra_1333 [Legionella gratiana]STX46533.1 Uncharacterised protein [Legionella gratiana]